MPSIFDMFAPRRAQPRQRCRREMEKAEHDEVQKHLRTIYATAVSAWGHRIAEVGAVKEFGVESWGAKGSCLQGTHMMVSEESK
jgi:hypothetical protein